MLFVLFKLGSERYAMEASRVVEVVPLLALKRFPQAPRGVAGVFVYRGQPVPAVDLCELIFNRPAQERLSTRILVINYEPPGREASGNPLLGLIAERATGSMRCDAGEFKDVGVNLSSTPYLGPVLMDAQGVIQLVHAEKLLSERVQRLLAPVATGAAADANLKLTDQASGDFSAST